METRTIHLVMAKPGDSSDRVLVGAYCEERDATAIIELINKCQPSYKPEIVPVELYGEIQTQVFIPTLFTDFPPPPPPATASDF